MKNILKTFIIFTLSLFIFIIGGSKLMAKSGINDIYHIVVTPSVDTSKEMTINYHSNISGSIVYLTTSDDVNYEKALELKPNEEYWSTENYEKTSKTSTFYTKKRYVCTLELKDLNPRTKYIFKIKLNNEFTKEYSFVTSGLTNEFTFLAFTDFQNPNNTVSHTLIKNLREYAKESDLVICSGDATGTGGLEEDWTWLIDNDTFSNFVYACSPGDHEYWADDTGSPYPMYAQPYTYNHLFDFPKNGASSSLNSNYYFYYNNVLFVSLDMSDSNTSSGTKFTDQVDWFKKTIKELDGTYQYLIVFDHKSIYGAYNEDSSVAKRLRPQWYPVFDEFNVDLVLSGHDHMYSRTYRLYNNKVSTDPKVGTYYLDMGSSGNKRRATDEQMATDGLHECLLPLKDQSLTLGAVINVTKSGISVEVLDLNKKVQDQFYISAKRDPLTYTIPEISDEDLSNLVSIKSTGNNNGILTYTQNSSSAYVKKIQVYLGRKSLTSIDINSNTLKENEFSKLTGSNLTIKYTLVDDSVRELPYNLDIGEIKDFELSYNSNTKKAEFNFTNNLDFSFDYYLYIYQNEQLVKIFDTEVDTLPVEVDSSNLFKDVTYKVDIYDYDLEGIIKTFEETISSKTIEIKDVSESIILKENQTFDIELISDYKDLLSLKVTDKKVASIDELTLKGLKAGETTLQILFNSKVLLEVKVIVNADESLTEEKQNAINNLNNKFNDINKDASKYDSSSLTKLIDNVNSYIDKINNSNSIDEIQNLYNEALAKFEDLKFVEKTIEPTEVEPTQPTKDEPKSGCKNYLISLFTVFSLLILFIRKRKSIL